MSLRHAGFTLVELVVVMSILGIIGSSAVFFLLYAGDSLGATINRDRVSSQARYASEFMSRRVRQSLPQSVRENGLCLELIPVLAATNYLTLPTATSANSLRAVAVPGIDPTGSRVAVGGADDVYQLSNPGSVSPTVTVTDGAPGEWLLSFASPHRFVAESADDRLFFVGAPESYCQNGADLWRYRDYGFLDPQPTLLDLPSGLPGRALLTESVAVAFQVTPPTLTRNALVDLQFAFSMDDAPLQLSYQLQVANVP